MQKNNIQYIELKPHIYKIINNFKYMIESNENFNKLKKNCFLIENIPRNILATQLSINSKIKSYDNIIIDYLQKNNKFVIYASFWQKFTYIGYDGIFCDQHCFNPKKITLYIYKNDDFLKGANVNSIVLNWLLSNFDDVMSLYKNKNKFIQNEFNNSSFNTVINETEWNINYIYDNVAI